MPKPISAPIAAEVRQDVESEAALIQRAKKSLSDSSWEVGECASLWTARYSRGRTDEDFGAAVGMSGDQVYQRRRVWDRFGISDLSRKLSWTHSREALTWDDADTCLQWAYDMEATVAEMKAWRNAQNGTSQAADEFLSGMGETVDDSDPFGEGEGEDGGTDSDGKETEEEEPVRPPRNGREAPEPVQKTQQELFAEQKAKTVKTLEAGSRAISDLTELHPVPKHNAMVQALYRMIESIKACK